MRIRTQGGVRTLPHCQPANYKTCASANDDRRQIIWWSGGAHSFPSRQNRVFWSSRVAAIENKVAAFTAVGKFHSSARLACSRMAQSESRAPVLYHADDANFANYSITEEFLRIDELPYKTQDGTDMPLLGSKAPHRTSFVLFFITQANSEYIPNC